MSDPARSCPCCTSSMSPHTVHNLRLDICDSCGGVWFDAGEFGRISRLGSRAVDEVVAAEPLNLKPVVGAQPHGCPVCAVQLNIYHFAGSSDITLAGCSGCSGIYLSREDLIKLDKRDRRLEHRDGALNEDEAASVSALDGQIAADTFRTNLAKMNWAQLQTPVMFS